MANKHCDSVSIDKLFNLADRLNLNTQDKIANVFAISKSQLINWIKKGRVPQYRYDATLHALKDQFKKEYDEKLKLIEDEDEE